MTVGRATMRSIRATVDIDAARFNDAFAGRCLDVAHSDH